jgi:glycine cleavage system aminomethyltransferase T
MALADFKPIHHFGDPAGEATACRTACALFDFSFLECAQLRGDAARQAVQRFSARSVAALPVGRIGYALRLNADGKLVADLTIWRTAIDSFEVISGRREDIIDLCASSGDAAAGVTVSQITDRATFAVQGPAALETLRHLGKVESLEALPYFAFSETTLAGVACRVGRLGYTGEAGFEIMCPRGVADDLWQAIARHARPAGFIALDMLRIEAGFVLFSHEFCLPVSPAEAGLAKFYQGGPLPPPELALVSFVADADRADWPWQPGARLSPPSPGEIAVTSACASVVAGGILGLGYIRAEHQPGGPLHDAAGLFRNIRQTPLPYYDTAKRRPRSSWRRPFGRGIGSTSRPHRNEDS